jgi:hypothetical protein
MGWIYFRNFNFIFFIIMNYKDLSRPLDISDVDFRVQSINNGGYATVLAYKDARVDMNRLDEVLGVGFWTRDYKMIDNQLFCGIGIYNDVINQWVWKWDVGTESMTEAQKGRASDAFKRACFNLGIGRELYDYPLISIKLNENEWSKDGGRPEQTYNLKIKDWVWYSEFTEGKLSFLAAKDDNRKLRFTWGKMKPKEVEPEFKPAAVAVEPVEVIVEPVVDTDANIEGLVKKTRAKKIPATVDDLVAETPTIESFYEEMKTIKDPKEFILWAKNIATQFNDSATTGQLEEFKTLCNNHYKLITA